MQQLIMERGKDGGEKTMCHDDTYTYRSTAADIRDARPCLVTVE